MKEIKFVVEKKGLNKQLKHCPNCDIELTLWINDKGIIEKSVDVTIVDAHHVNCKYCGSVLKY